MSQFLQDAKHQLLAPFFREPMSETKVFMQLMEQAKSEQVELARWLFEEQKLAFTSTRMKAGLFLYQQFPDIFWPIVEKLAKSENLDDQDTACSLLCELGDPRAYEIVKPFIWDKYLQFEAIDFLVDIYPSEVIQRLRTLVNSEEGPIRKQAEERLAKLEKSSK